MSPQNNTEKTPTLLKTSGDQLIGDASTKPASVTSDAVVSEEHARVVVEVKEEEIKKEQVDLPDYTTTADLQKLLSKHTVPKGYTVV